MKPTIYATSLLLAAGSGPAIAACAASGSYVQVDPRTILIGNTACYPTTPPYENQEQHFGGNTGRIIEYKLAAVADPTADIGGYTTKTLPNGGTVTYNYTGASTFVYTIWGTTTAVPGTYDFCNGTTPLSVRVIVGQAAC
ncbi:MAG: hypothetical protein EXR07_10235 [Acetobacteraceae bacterium]|nr:hypothetical protein [Acetobacteraceae bacterium]